MRTPKLTRFELRIMEALWTNGACSIREIREAMPARNRPAYTTVQTTVYRMEAKGAVRCTKRIANANIFEASVSRGDAQRRLIDELLGLFGGQARPIMARLVESGSVTIEDIRDAELMLRKLSGKERS